MGRFEINIDEYLPLRDVVFQTLRKAILTGQLQPGERLMEIQLGEEMGVSRTPIREAIRKLEIEGLVTNYPRRGAQVAEISKKGLKDVLEVRRSLDAFCAELASKRITEEDKEALVKACKDFEDAIATKDSTLIAKADVAFHDIIIGATDNDRLMATIENLQGQMYRYRFEYIKDESRHERLVSEHRIMVEAILNGDSELASKTAKEHIDNQERSILDSLH